MKVVLGMLARSDPDSEPLKETAEMLLKLHNYDLISKGKPPVDELPQGTDTAEGSWLWGRITPFEDPHPLRDL